MLSSSRKIKDFAEFCISARFSRKAANFTENVMKCEITNQAGPQSHLLVSTKTVSNEANTHMYNNQEKEDTEKKHDGMDDGKRDSNPADKQGAESRSSDEGESDVHPGVGNADTK